MSDIYYRVIAKTGVVVTLQDFDERDYDPAIWLTDGKGAPLKFGHAGDAEQTYFGQVRAIAEAIQMIGEAFGKLTIPDESRFLAHKLVSQFNTYIPTNEKSK